MKNINRRKFVKLSSSGLTGLMLPGVLSSADLNIIDHPSPKRRTRPNRISTNYILLHTTEASSRSSLNSLTRFGNANYMVDANGDIYRIMGLNQISTGAGRSMWNGRTNLDNYSINIEFAGYHNKEPTERQLQNGKELVSELKGIHRQINDEEIMPHGMVAYGAPNRWHRNFHRGRKRCGMLFAKESVRKELGLGPAPRIDPDVASRRLVVADRYLESVLYGRGRAIAESVEHEDESEDIISTINEGESVWTYAGNSYADSTTTYFLPDGRIRRGDELKRQGFNFDSILPGTKIAVGYTYGGHVSENRSAYQIAEKNWNLPSTIYGLPNGEIKTGGDINESSIPRGTLVLFRR